MIIRILIIFCAIMNITAYKLYACDCDSIIALPDTKIAFKGVVTKIKQKQHSYEYEVTFRIKEVLKGKIKTRYFTVMTPCLIESCCGIPFELGSFYYVITREKRGILYSDFCTATEKLDSILKDSSILFKKSYPDQNFLVSANQETSIIWK